jgi:hypothetical protein
MPPKAESTKLLNEEFRRIRNQKVEVSSTKFDPRTLSVRQVGRQDPPKKRNPEDTYDTFLIKYKKLLAKDLTVIDRFNTLDLVYYFAAKVKENIGIGYEITLGVEAKKIGSLRKKFSNQEIMTMIDFFTSRDQRITRTIQITTMTSGYYINRVYQDSILWAKGEYHPPKTSKSSRGYKDSQFTKEVKGSWGWD